VVDFEEKLKYEVGRIVERQLLQVCPKYFSIYIKSSRVHKSGSGNPIDMIAYYKSLTPSQKKKIKKAERMFLEDSITFYETEIKRFDGMNKIYEDKFAKYLVLSFV